MKRSAAILLASVLALMLWGEAQNSFSYGAPAQSDIVIRSAQSKWKSGSKITISVKETFLTAGSASIIIEPPPYREPYYVTVHLADGSLALRPGGLGRYGIRPLGGGTAFVTTVKAGQTWSNEIVVSDLYDMSHPGKYALEVSRESVSNEIRVTVVR